MLLPLNDLHGEIRGMVGKNMLKAQLQTSMIRKPSIAKDRGALSFTLSRGERRGNDENTTNSLEQNLMVKKHRRIMKNDHGTQTEATSPPILTSRGLLEPAYISVSTEYRFFTKMVYVVIR